MTDSNQKDREEQNEIRQKKRDRFYGCERNKTNLEGNGLPVPDQSARDDDREIREESQQQISGQLESFSAGEKEERYNEYRRTHKITPENEEHSEE